MQKLIIDADPGIGDAIAIALAAADPQIDLLAVTAVNGCLSAKRAGRNIQTLLEWLDLPKNPRLGRPETEDTDDVAGRLAGETALAMRRLHGEYGLGSWQTGDADLHHPRDSAKMLCEVSLEHPHEVTLLTLGPLTNVALAQRRDHEFLSRLKGLVILGGTYAVPGDVSPVAEMNMAMDPVSARSVLRSPATKTLVPLDVSRNFHLTFDQYQRLVQGTDSRTARLFTRLLPEYLRAHHEWLGMESALLPEVTALYAVTHPEKFQRRTCSIDVETDGFLTKGMTVIDRRARPEGRNNIDVLTNVDPQAVADQMRALLRVAN